MDHFKSRVLLICITFSFPLALAFGSKTIYLAKSQADTILNEIGWEAMAPSQEMQGAPGMVAVSLLYTRSFKDDGLAKLLFGGCSRIFSGSRVKNRGQNDVLADYLGLPPSFKSVVCMRPRISDVMLDMSWYQSLALCVPGAYLRIHMPIVSTKWDVHFSEAIFNTGDEPESAPFTLYPAGYMGSTQIARADMHVDVRDAFEGKKRVGDREPLRFGVLMDRRTKTRVTEIQLTLGYDISKGNAYYVGCMIEGAIPTGTRPNSKFFFEPVVGNAHHAQLGCGMQGYGLLWLSDDEASSIGLHLEGHIHHLFSDKQYRSYDIVDAGNGSRYMLLQEMTSSSNNLRVGALNGPAALHQYTGRLLPAINATTLKTAIQIAMQGNCTGRLSYASSRGFLLDGGYSFYGRSQERIGRRCSVPAERYALKGDAQIYGFDALDLPIRLEVSQSTATLHAGLEGVSSTYINGNADLPAFAFDAAGASINQLSAADSVALSIPQAQIRTSSAPIFLADDKINESSGLVDRALSHTFFLNIARLWDHIDGIAPYLAAGIAVELGGHDLCKNSALSKWGMWLKGGLAY